MPNVFVTTSWDDEDRSGLKVAELLSRHGLRGTFYVPTGKLGQESCFTAEDLRTLSASGFEIGAHTVSHAILPNLAPKELDGEVSDCKSRLQEILGAEVTMFCYPKGRFNREVMTAVRRAGYGGARSTQMLNSSATFEQFAIPTTLQAYPHRRSNYVRNLLRLRAGGALLRSIPELISFSGWLDLGKARFDRVLRQGGVWHLYGHPWEIEQLGLWPQLNQMLEYVSGRANMQYVTNGKLLSFAKDVEMRDPELTNQPPQSVAH